MPFPHHEDLYYVCRRGLANCLVTTPQGNILINSDLEASVPMLDASIEKLGFKFKKTAILLISHAFWDHARFQSPRSAGRIGEVYQAKSTAA